MPNAPVRSGEAKVPMTIEFCQGAASVEAAMAAVRCQSVNVINLGFPHPRRSGGNYLSTQKLVTQTVTSDKHFIWKVLPDSGDGGSFGDGGGGGRAGGPPRGENGSKGGGFGDGGFCAGVRAWARHRNGGRANGGGGAAPQASRVAMVVITGSGRVVGSKAPKVDKTVMVETVISDLRDKLAIYSRKGKIPLQGVYNGFVLSNDIHVK